MTRLRIRTRTNGLPHKLAKHLGYLIALTDSSAKHYKNYFRRAIYTVSLRFGNYIKNVNLEKFIDLEKSSSFF